MPIDFSPPSGSLQGYQISSPQSTDPLQTLAQMGQLRTQNLQRQGAEQDLELNRAKLDSQKGMLKAMLDSGGDMKKFQSLIAQPGYNILPGDALAYQEHQNKLLQDRATRTETENKNRATNIDLLRGLYRGVADDQGITDAHSKATQLGIPDNIPRYSGPFDQAHLTAFSNGLAGESQLIKEGQEKAATEASQATKAREEVLTTEGKQKVTEGEKRATIADLQGAPQGPDGLPTPAAAQAIQLKHPTIILPTTKEEMARFVRSGVPTEKQPEYDLAQRINELGMFGKDQWDQFLYQNAKTFQNPDGTPKKPGQVTPQEYNTIKQKWAEYTADPVIRALAIGQKTGQEKLINAQVASLPSPEAIDGFARDLLNLDMAPSQFSELRSGRVSWGPQVFQRAREMAQAEGKTFSPATLDAKFKTWENTEKAFGDGEEAGLVRAFGNLMKHSSMAVDASKALSHHDLPALQRIAGVLGVASGGSAETVYDTIADFVKDEAAKAFLPGGGGQSERAEKLSHFERGLGDKARTDNLKALMSLADSQREELERQYAEGTFGKGPRIGKLFSTEVLAARDKVMGRPAAAGGGRGGGTGGKITVIAGDGSTHPFDTEAQAKIFEDSVKAAGGTTRRQ